ncbi:MAG: hypothetical protein ABI947_05340 [Chloroflexota bacterium]
MRQLRQKIRVRERLPFWGLRLILGVILLTLSELVMWQNPPARTPLDWVILLILYICLGAILMEIIVRFQVHGPATLVLASGIYGLVASAIINHTAFDNLAVGPYGLLVRGLGLQTAAGLYGLLLFVVVMRGKPAESLQVFAAMGIGALWGIWVHWYPIQPLVDWELVPIETATLYVIVALVIIGVLVARVAPRFLFLREQQMGLLWWEAIIVGVPLFIALIVGMFQEVVPIVPLVVFAAIGAFIVWTLHTQRQGHDPSLLAEITFPAPNVITYIVLAVSFLVAGTVAYSLVNDRDSVVGIAVYYIAFAFGTFGLPVALLIIFWRVFRAQTAPIEDDLEDLLDEEE